MRTAMRAKTTTILMLALAAVPAGAATTRVGTEFRVNTYTFERQEESAVAVDDDGDFVVAWISNGQDGQSYGVFAQRFASSGAPVAAEFIVNSYTQTFQQYVDADMDAEGDFVIVWTSYRQDGLNSGIFGQRYASSGAAVGTDFQINVVTVAVQSLPSIAMEDNGQFVVAWQSAPTLLGTGFNVFGRLFDSNGAASGGEFQVSTYTGSNQTMPAAAADADGDFVVAWTSSAADGSGIGNVFMQRFSSSGARVGTDFKVNSFSGSTPDNEVKPAAAMDADGDFVVAWTMSNQDGSGHGVFGRRFSSTGAPSGEFRINIRTADGQRDPTVAMDLSGRFVVAWSSENQDGSLTGVIAREFTRTGTSVAGEFQVNTTTAYLQLEPAIAIEPFGKFVIAWTGGKQVGFEAAVTEIFAQRFALSALPALDIDGDGETEPLTDGLLNLRRRFGFTGATLITGAVDLVNCTRCTAPSIEQYLTALGPLLDIDGDDELQPLTDGLLVARWLFGFRGATLTNNAVDLSDCTRCTAQPIRAHLETLDP